uniref:non-specific serine/threonine protein kinase n=1 Tax=Fagus sylvatica TaxID=28930 RepID=A0A2N9ERT2_FAGSY
MFLLAQQNHSNAIPLGSSLSPIANASWLSPSGIFAFGFYPQGNGFAIGIWLVNKSENIVVWTANRDSPPVSPNTMLNLKSDGLLLRTGQGEENPIANLSYPADSAFMHDSGNFVLYNTSSDVIWESFAFPTDTILGGQNLTVANKLVSSVSGSDHSSGRFYLWMQTDGNLVSYPVNNTATSENSYWSTGTTNTRSSTASKPSTASDQSAVCPPGSTCIVACSKKTTYNRPCSESSNHFTHSYDYNSLSLNQSGLLSLTNSRSNIYILANISYPAKKETTPIIYRAILESDGIFKLYSHRFLGNTSSHLEWSALRDQCEVKGFCGFNSYCNRNRKTVPKSCLEETVNCGAAYYTNGTCSKYKLPLRYAIKFIRYRKLSPENVNVEFAENLSLRSFSYNELENATDGFKEVLGKGSFGSVYKGYVSEANKTIAVKRLEKFVEEGEREFRAEMTAIGRTHHKNLVQLLGFCIEGSRKLLVYEYMSNGSLADFLFKAKKRPLWKERVRIALEVARGVFYLHQECEVHIIHCNLKPQNILMDDTWTAKISDFGLARLSVPNQTRNITMSMEATSGYSAPEWQKNALISVKSDIYSYGVMLLEIVCCRSNIEELDKLVEDENVDMKTLERMVKVGLWCIQEDPALRPPMKNVILMLEGTMDIAVLPSPAISQS